jgi:hypothetical protein
MQAQILNVAIQYIDIIKTRQNDLLRAKAHLREQQLALQVRTISFEAHACCIADCLLLYRLGDVGASWLSGHAGAAADAVRARRPFLHVVGVSVVSRTWGRGAVRVVRIVDYCMCVVLLYQGIELTFSLQLP